MRISWKRAISTSSLAIIILAASACSHGPSAISPVPGEAAGRARMSGPAPNHVLTWLTLGETGGPNLSPQQVVQWVDYTMTKQSFSQIAHGLGMKTIMYTNPNFTGPGNLLHTNDETTYAHDCKGNRIEMIQNNLQAMNVYSSHLWSLWPSAVQQMMSWGGGGVYDYVFEDNADTIAGNKLTATPCNFQQQGWTSNTNTLDGDLGYPIIYNGLSHVPQGTSSPAPAIGLNPTAGGGMAEECYVGRTPTGFHYVPQWLGIENTELEMQAQSRVFVCHGTAYVEAASNDALRTYFYASYLLSYDVGTSIINTEFQTPSQVTVMPEAQLVPQAPLVPTPQSIDALQEPSGVYGREYASCYLAGQLIGACSVAVNPNNPGKGPPLAYPWPGKYTHTLTMSGAGAYDGGTVGVDGPAPPSQMAGGTAVIAFP